MRRLPVNESPMESKIISINSRKFDGRIHRTWNAELIEVTDELIAAVGRFEFDVAHSHLGVIRKDSISHEFFWRDRWFNIFRFHEPDGALRNFYCNISKPPNFENNVLDFIDLEIDIVVWKDMSYEILDREEYERASREFNFPADIRKRVEISINQLNAMIKSNEFPFNKESFM